MDLSKAGREKGLRVTPNIFNKHRKLRTAHKCLMWGTEWGRNKSKNLNLIKTMI